MTDLPYGLTPAALEAATAEADPDSLGAAGRLRARFEPRLAAAALQQASLRRRARTKFGSAAADLFFTREGLEQATRPEVADLHAARLRAAGVTRVVDLGCGIGSDALAFVRAGLQVLAVDSDPDTAAVARSNLGENAEVRCADAGEVVTGLGPEDAVWLDPARRNDRGRLWRVEDFTPAWSLVTDLLAGGRVVGVKLGPALPHSLVPDEVEAEWVSHRGEVVEATLWAGSGSRPGLWSALVVPGHRLEVPAAERRRADPLPVRGPGAYLYEPDGAVIRAGGVRLLGAELGAGVLDPHIAYLTADELWPTPYAVAFEVLEVLPYDRKRLRRWVAEHGVGTLEIKKRGLVLDPAELRRRLAPRGPASATLLVSRTSQGTQVIVGRRVPAPS